MATLARLLVAVDFTPAAASACDLAIDLGRRYGSELIFCTVVDEALLIAEMSTPDVVAVNMEETLVRVDRSARSHVDEAVARAVAAGVRASSRFLEGRPSNAIVACAEREGADGIVMGTMAKRGLERAYAGSVADSVLRATAIPTLVVHATVVLGTPAVRAPFERIFVALDDSEAADVAAAYAIEVAALASAAIVYGTIVETGDLLYKAAMYQYDPTSFLEELHAAAKALLEKHVAAARRRGLAATSVVVEDLTSNAILAGGDVSLALLEAARSARADVIVIGSHGRRGLRRLFFGSIAESVVSRGTLPTMVVRYAA